MVYQSNNGGDGEVAGSAKSQDMPGDQQQGGTILP